MTVKTRDARRGEDYERLLCQERLILDVTERLVEALNHEDITRAELAVRLGRTSGFVSQVLGGGRNLTLRTIADISAALSVRPSFELSHIRTVVETRAPVRQDVPNLIQEVREDGLQETAEADPVYALPLAA